MTGSGGARGRRVLSIQSHVVSGCVGNKAAVFPLQLLGFEVDPVNSVQFSNHTGYPVVTGKDQILRSENLKSLMEGLAANHLNKYSHVLTGYIGSESFLNQVSHEISQLKLINPSLLYHCDPVLGDNGLFYVPESLVQVYRDQVLPIADAITPNDFELRQLSGEPCDTLENTLVAIDKLHSMGPKTIVLSSIALNDEGDNDDGNNLTLICSCKLNDGNINRARLDFPRIDAPFTGTGDLFSALFLAWCDICGTSNCGEACERAVSTIHKVLTTTMQHQSEQIPNSHHNGACKGVPPELKLIASKSFIEKGEKLFRTTMLKTL